MDKGLKKEHFFAQFHHQEKYAGHPDDTRPEWWEKHKFVPNHNAHRKVKKVRQAPAVREGSVEHALEIARQANIRV